MFGRHPRHRFDTCLPSPTTIDQLVTSDDLSGYHRCLLSDLLPAYAQPRELLDFSHHRQACQYDQHRHSL